MVHGALYEDVALKVADFLLQIKAVKLQTEIPFTWASGIRSPIYCDNRITLSHPEVRSFICDSFVERISTEFEPPDVIAGVATGAIAHGVLVAQKLNLPFIYVRDSAKKHGRGNLIEGQLFEGQKVLVIEDLISTGRSSLNAVRALREKKLNVLGLLAIFTYELAEAELNFQQEICPFQTLSNYSYLLETAKKTNIISENELISLKKWSENPHQWFNG